ncbi:MAG: cation-translocating P-type ATPase [Coriobacteriia bacterium]|jgi:Ca2+-transporting ATPase|nr:cation-translocating P-type ATPase [Coriobacteriia bacterium]
MAASNDLVSARDAQRRPWHSLGAEEALAELDGVREGLSAAEAAARFETYGANVLPEGEVRTLGNMIADQFKDFLILLLIAAAAISAMLGEVTDTIAIIVIILLNATIGVIQEYRAERAMEALREMAAAHASVRRDGQLLDISAADLVPGDIVLLEAGRVVPADLRIVESAQLRIAEAALTGESEAVEKRVEPVTAEETALGDRISMAYRGTQVVHGRGEGVVVETGISTELGRIADLLARTEDVKTPLQKRLAGFGRTLGLAALALCAVVFVVGVIRGEEPLLMFMTAVSLAVAAVPEALPAVATITLALGARRMVRTNALVRKLPAVETLGSVTYICTDKTGTLTVNRMVAERFLLASGEAAARPDEAAGPVWEEYWRAMSLCSDVVPSQDGDALGDPTETALYVAAAAAGHVRNVVEKRWPRVAELPFDSERKLMTTFHSSPDGGVVSVTKGAAEAVLARSATEQDSAGSSPIDTEELEAVIDEISGDGLRVLAFGTRRFDDLPEDLSAAERDMVFLGLAGLMDPPREEAAEAVRLCKTAGVVPVMITGDHPATALSIARRIGIAERETEVVTGIELDRLTLEELESRVLNTHVYARVAPEQKLKIVSALQDKGQFVAMTGDGVNDAPALKQADIGVAMGITGTDVAKEAASMILLDDNFSTIVHAVEEGRRIYDNIRKFIGYILPSNAGEIFTILLAPFLGLPIPLLPIHILWVNLVTDGLPGLAYAAEPAEKDIMKRPPRPPEQSVLADGMAARVLWVGLLLGAVTLAVMAFAMNVLGDDVDTWRSMAFTTLCLSQLGNALAVRSTTESAFSQGLFSNRLMTGALMISVLAQLATLYVPFLNPVFRTVPLAPLELGIVLAASTVVFWAVEAEKLVRRRLARRDRAEVAAQ